MNRIIYLDNAATTQVSDEVLNEMLPFFKQTYSNPSAIYSFAGESKKATDRARLHAVELIGAKPEEMYFTSGGSESDNWALKAVVDAYADKGKHIITSKIEHHAMKLKQLARRSALTYKAQAGAICVLESVKMDAPKTKSVVALTEALKVADKKVLLVLPETNVNLQLSCRNIPNVLPVLAQNVCTYDVMNASAIVMVEGAENVLNTLLA